MTKTKAIKNGWRYSVKAKNEYPKMHVVKDCMTETWTVVLHSDEWNRQQTIREGFDTERSANSWASKHTVCLTCSGSGKIVLSQFSTAIGEYTLAACIECNGERIR